MPVRLTWQDVDAIATALAATHPGRNPLGVTSQELARLVVSLPGFVDDPDAAGAESLEAIQAAWYEAFEQ
jgi:FeS assembly protein IscX